MEEPAYAFHYKDLLRASVRDTLHSIDRANSTDEAWGTVKAWIRDAAIEACGTIKYKPRTPKNFWTQKLTKLREEVQRLILCRQALPSNLPSSVYDAAASSVKDATAALNVAITARKLELFQESANRLGTNGHSNSLMKILHCKKARLERAGCKLDPQEMDTHIRHFENTFGAAPTHETTSEAHLQAEYTPIVFAEKEVADKLAWLAKGKAAGADGFMAEFLVEGQEVMARVLTTLFNRISRDCRIPQEWTTALIVPVYKGKGSETLIKNYRPIALTVIARRLYERLLLAPLKHKEKLLNRTQAGFRKNRSTLDHCYTLDSLFQLHGPGLKVALMDLSAAFDSVDRTILWDILKSKYSFEHSDISRLQDLFDRNSSQIVIKGSKSNPIANRRGLLQGSSLSPFLFNFFVDPLLVQLDRVNMGLSSVMGNLNGLAFADDVALMSRTTDNLQLLVTMCESWAMSNGMKFNTSKCHVLTGKRIEPPLLYGTALTIQSQGSYLGLPFTTQGIDHAANVEARAAKAKNITMMFSRFGMNLGGYPQAASMKVYKAFIRPVMEYGLGLVILPKKVTTVLQKVQNIALRKILTAPNSTSIAGMHKLLCIETMETRNHVLALKFTGRIHNNSDISIPAVKVWRYLATSTRTANPLLKNPLIQEQLLDVQLVRPRSTDGPSPLPLVKVVSRTNLMKYLSLSISAMGNGIPGSVSASIMGSVYPRQFRHCFTAFAFPRGVSDRVPVIRWLTGNVARRSQCMNSCSAILTRRHAVSCSGALEYLIGLFRESFDTYTASVEEDDDGRSTFLDFLLNQFRYKPPTPNFYEQLSTAIGLIYTKCMLYVQKPNGFYVPTCPTSSVNEEVPEIEPEPDP